MIVDIVVTNLQIENFKPDEEGQDFPMPNDDLGKVPILQYDLPKGFMKPTVGMKIHERDIKVGMLILK